MSPTKSEDGVVLRLDDLRLKERVTIRVETLALLFSSVKVKKQPITISDEAKQRLKLGVPKMFKSYIELGVNRTAGWTSALGISRMVELIAINSKKSFSLLSGSGRGIWL